MAKDPDELSALEQRVMLALTRKHPNGYGVSVQDEIKERTGKVISFGSIYATLDRLEERGFVSPRQGEATRERGGRRKVYFTVTAPGERALRASLTATDNMRRGLFGEALA